MRSGNKLWQACGPPGWHQVADLIRIWPEGAKVVFRNFFQIDFLKKSVERERSFGPWLIPSLSGIDDDNVFQVRGAGLNGLDHRVVVDLFITERNHPGFCFGHFTEMF